MSKGFVDRRLENQWDRQLEDGLPDCRTKNREKDRVYRAHMWWEKVYCANCTRLYGLVTADFSPHVFAICDDCVGVMGPPPGAIEAKDVPVIAA